MSEIIDQLIARVNRLSADVSHLIRLERLHETPWTDYFASSTVVGWSSYTASNIYTTRFGKLAFVGFLLFGTSNSVNTSFTLPWNSNSILSIDQVLRGMDNSVWLNQCLAELTPGSNVVNCYPGFGGGNWTNANTKRVAGQFFYITA